MSKTFHSKTRTEKHLAAAGKRPTQHTVWLAANQLESEHTRKLEARNWQRERLCC